MRTLRIVILAMTVLILFSLLAFIFGYTVAERDFAEQHKNDRDTVWMEADTVRMPPTVKDSIIKEPYPYPVPVMMPGGRDTFIDTIIAQIPMIQQHYAYPDTADIWVTGFNTRIDSAIFYNRHATKYIYNTTPEKAVRLTLETGIEGILVEDCFAPAVFLEGGVVLWRRVSVSAGFGVSHSKSAAHGFMYGKLAYRIH